MDRPAARVEQRKLLEPPQRSVRPGGDCLGRLSLKRVVTCEQHPGPLPLPARVQLRRAAERHRLAVGPDAEVDEDGRSARWPRSRRLVVTGENRGATGDARCRSGGDCDDEDRPTTSAHRRHGSHGTRGYPQLVVKVREVSAHDARESDALLVDVRSDEEWRVAHIPGALHVPMSQLEARLPELVRDRKRPIITYCAVGARSLRVLPTLDELGYEDSVSMTGGIVAWQEFGFPVESDSALDEEQRTRYSRHLLIPEVGEEGQRRLLQSSILLIGAGGLGSPSALYLAAAGVGRIGIVDDDAVDASNLQRQVLHSTAELGRAKAQSAKQRLEELNPDVDVVTYEERLTSENVDRILGEGWDLVVDGADNFPTRYLLNDASVWHDVPVVHGSIFRFEGQVTVFKPREGPCYRCLFPEPPPPELAPSCAEGGVLGVLPGVIGSLQANEALKLALGIGEPAIGRLLLFDALSARLDEVAVRRDPDCPVCGENPTITGYIDYAEFCAAR
jgi:molybdopterin/thiamine biosynthesis adenylyltransferase/rhodanese-related sulfurtransferase